METDGQEMESEREREREKKKKKEEEVQVNWRERDGKPIRTIKCISETMAPPSAAPGERQCFGADWRDLFSMHHQIASLHPPPVTKPIRMRRLPGQSNHLKVKGQCCGATNHWR